MSSASHSKMLQLETFCEVSLQPLTSQTHGLDRIRAVTCSPIRRTIASLWRRQLIFRTIAMICEISLNSIQSVLSPFYKDWGHVHTEGTHFAIYTKLCMEMAEGHISFVIHQNVRQLFFLFFLKDDVITHTILSVNGQLDGNRHVTANFAKHFYPLSLCR